MKVLLTNTWILGKDLNKFTGKKSYYSFMVRNDPLWKGIIQELVFPFLTFFFPDENFDFNFVPEFHDKELEQIFPRSDTDSKRRLVDKLIKAKTISGEEKWFLIHIEVQGYRDKKLPERMFQCFYRILDSFKMPVASLVIYTDAIAGYYPDTYHYKVAGTELFYSFQTYKVLDQSKEDLEKMDNPFALVILTVLESLKMQSKSNEQQVNTKLDLVRRLAKKSYDREYITTMMSFIRFYVILPDEKMNLMFEKKVEELVANKNMPMGVEEILLQQAEEKGLEEGLEKGLRKGLTKGRREERAKANQKLKEAIRNMLREGFSVSVICKVLEVPEDFVREIEARNS